MIENMSRDELNELISELKASGYDVKENRKENRKGVILEQEAKELGMENPYICDALKKPIYNIIDWVTKNTEEKTPKSGGATRTYKKNTVDPSIEKEYRRMCKDILKSIQPYYGAVIGFRERKY